MWVELIEPLSFFGVLFLLAMFVIVAVFAEDDNPGGALFFFLVGLALLTLFSSFRPLRFVSENWLLLVVLVPVYLAAGLAWALYKWRAYVRDPASYSSGVTRLDPNTATYRRRIVSWILWWPMSIAWQVLAWPRRVATMIYDNAIGLFDRVSDNARRS